MRLKLVSWAGVALLAACDRPAAPPAAANDVNTVDVIDTSPDGASAAGNEGEVNEGE